MLRAHAQAALVLVRRRPIMHTSQSGVFKVISLLLLVVSATCDAYLYGWPLWPSGVGALVCKLHASTCNDLGYCMTVCTFMYSEAGVATGARNLAALPVTDEAGLHVVASTVSADRRCLMVCVQSLCKVCGGQHGDGCLNQRKASQVRAGLMEESFLSQGWCCCVVALLLCALSMQVAARTRTAAGFTRRVAGRATVMLLPGWKCLLHS